MKIVFGKDVFYPHLSGGGEVHTFKVAQKLVEFGHDVTVICGKTSQFPDDSTDDLKLLKDEEIIDGIRIVRPEVPYTYGSSIGSLPALFKMYKKLKEMIKNGDVDIVNFDLYRPCIPFFLASKNKIPQILSARVLAKPQGKWKGWKEYDSNIFNKFLQFSVEELVLHFPYKKIFVDSKDVANEIRRYYPEEKIEIVYNAVDIKQFDQVKSNKKIPNQVVFLGGLRRRKGILDAIKAVELAKKEINDLKFIIISDGGEFETIVKENSKKKGYVSYYKKPNFEEKIKLLKESSLLIFPSHKEGFPLVPLEANACHIPFIAYDIPSMKEELKLTSGGVLVPYSGCKALSRKICELLKNESEIKKLANKGRENVEKKFTWDAVARREEKVFKEVLDEWQ